MLQFGSGIACNDGDCKGRENDSVVHMKHIPSHLSPFSATDSCGKAVVVSIMLHVAVITVLNMTPMVMNISNPNILSVSLQSDDAISKKKSVSEAQTSTLSQKESVKNRHLVDTRQTATAAHHQSVSLEEDKPVPVTGISLAENQIPAKQNQNLSASSDAATADSMLSGVSMSGVVDGKGSEGNTPVRVIELRFGDHGAPAFLRREIPVYPELARRLGKEGRVLLKLLIDADGKLTNVEVVEGAGYGFTEASVAAVRKSTYAPGHRDGVKVPTRALLPVRFHLQ